MWDWRNLINDLRSDIREARSSGEESTTLDRLESRLDELKSLYERLEKEDLENQLAEEEETYEIQMKHWERYLAYFYDKASEYNRIVIAGAFVAYFAVWLRVYEQLNHNLSTLSVLFALSSLVVFVVWEIASNVRMSRKLRDEAVLFSKSGEEYIKDKEQVDREKRKAKIKFAPSWYVVLVFTISTGLIAAGSLMFGLILLVI